MLRQQIKTWFEEAVRLDLEAPQDLKEVLLRGHPRLEGFLDKMTEQVEQADKICQRRGLVLKKKTLQEFTYDMTRYFMKGLEGEAKRRHESDLQRIAREAEIQKQKDFDAVLAGMPEGEFLEAGVISNEETDKAREEALEKQDRIKKAKQKRTRD